ncbi:hypothetical protein MBBA_0486 [Methanoculleus bourgensis]|nr:hypothetical protein MBBA_0486 [Methanoculleus bourgensis]
MSDARTAITRGSGEGMGGAAGLVHCCGTGGRPVRDE